MKEDWNHGHPDTTKATSQHGISDPQLFIPPPNVTEGEERKIRVKEMSNKDLIGMKDGRSCPPINLESSGHPHLQFHSPNFVPAVHPHQDWNHGHPDVTKGQKTEHRGMTCQDENSLDEQSNACKKIHCKCIGSHYQQSSCEGCKANGISEDSCLGNACKKIHCECIGPNYQQPSCEGRSNCKMATDLRLWISMIFSQSKPGCQNCPQGEFNDRHQEYVRMAEHLIQNCKGQKTEHRDGTCCQNCEGPWTENSRSCCQVRGKPENSCSRCCNASREAQCKCRCPYGHYITTEVKETKAELQLTYKVCHALQPNKARDVSPPMGATNASVPQTYDAQKEPELVLQEGTEATSHHGIPDPQPLTPPHDATEHGERETRVEEDWNHGHPDATEATYQHGIPDPQPLIPPPDAIEDEERKTRMEEMSNEDLIGMKDGRLCPPINLESSGHLHLQSHSPNFVLAVLPHQDWNHGHLDAIKGQKTEHRGRTCQDENSLDEQNNACKKIHCKCIGSHYQQSSCEGCKANSISEDSCLGNACKKIHYECISPNYQQSSCEGRGNYKMAEYLIKNRKGQRSEHRDTTLQE